MTRQLIHNVDVKVHQNQHRACSPAEHTRIHKQTTTETHKTQTTQTCLCLQSPGLTRRRDSSAGHVAPTRGSLCHRQCVDKILATERARNIKHVSYYGRHETRRPFLPWSSWFGLVYASIFVKHPSLASVIHTAGCCWYTPQKVVTTPV